MKLVLIAGLTAFSLIAAAPVYTAIGKHEPPVADGGDYVGNTQQTADGGDFATNTGAG